jgi:hypothetical protein
MCSQVEGTAAPDGSCRTTAIKPPKHSAVANRTCTTTGIIYSSERAFRRVFLRAADALYLYAFGQFETDGMKTLFTSLGEMFRTAGELLRLFLRGGRLWLIPMIVVLLLFGMLLLLASTTPLGPFIYTLF